jgi:hypothetical protein
MISFNVTINNPFSKNFKNLWGRACGTPFLHKFIEFQIYKHSTIVSVNFSWSIRKDHAGLNIGVGLLGYCFDFNFYDSRHWNDSKKRFETYKE